MVIQAVAEWWRDTSACLPSGERSRVLSYRAETRHGEQSRVGARATLNLGGLRNFRRLLLPRGLDDDAYRCSGWLTIGDQSPSRGACDSFPEHRLAPALRRAALLLSLELGGGFSLLARRSSRPPSSQAFISPGAFPDELHFRWTPDRTANPSARRWGRSTPPAA